MSNLLAALYGSSAAIKRATGPDLSPGAHKYWRIITKTGAYNATDTAIGEVILKASVGGAQVATGGTALESNHAYSYTASLAFDGTTSGDAENVWATNDGDGNWIGYKLTAPINIREITIYPRDDATFYAQGPSELLFGYSDDGITWTEFRRETGLTWAQGVAQTFSTDNNGSYDPNAVNTIAAPPSTAFRYWRVRAQTTNGGNYAGDQLVLLTNVELRETVGGTNVATGGTAIGTDGYATGTAEDPASAFDGSPTSTWWQGKWLADDNCWIGYDFGAGNEKAIVEVVLVINAGYTTRTPNIAWVEASSDGVTWQPMWFTVFRSWTVYSRAMTKPTVAASKRYWGILCEEAHQADSYYAAAKIALISKGLDVTGNGTATGTAYPGGYDPSLAFDGDPSTFWVSGDKPQTFISYDFGAGVTHEITRVDWTARPDSYQYQSPYKGKVCYGDDGLNWIPLWTFEALARFGAGGTRSFTKNDGTYTDYTLTVPSGYVTDDLYDFPLYVALETLPDSFWETTRDGKDLRAFIDTEEIAIDCVLCDTIRRRGSAFVRVPHIDPTADLTLTIRVDGYSDRPQAHSGGRFDVWEDYAFVMIPSTGFTDRTGVTESFTKTGSQSYDAPYGTDLNVAGGGAMQSTGLVTIAGIDAATLAGTFTMAGSFLFQQPGSQTCFFDYQTTSGSQYIEMGVDNGTTPGSWSSWDGWLYPFINDQPASDEWHRMWQVLDKATLDRFLYYDGSWNNAADTSATDMSNVGLTKLVIPGGKEQQWIGYVGWCYLTGKVLSEAWIAAEYRMLFDPMFLRPSDMSVTDIGTNIGFETGDGTGWTLTDAVVTTGADAGGNAINAAFGAYQLSANNVPDAYGVQAIDVSSFATDIDAGKAEYYDRVGFGCASGSDSPGIKVEFLNATSSVLKTEWDEIPPITSVHYRLAYRNTAIPIGTRTIKITVNIHRTAGTQNNGVADIDYARIVVKGARTKAIFAEASAVNQYVVLKPKSLMAEASAANLYVIVKETTP